MDVVSGILPGFNPIWPPKHYQEKAMSTAFFFFNEKAIVKLTTIPLFKKIYLCFIEYINLFSDDLIIKQIQKCNDFYFWENKYFFYLSWSLRPASYSWRFLRETAWEIHWPEVAGFNRERERNRYKAGSISPVLYL